MAKHKKYIEKNDKLGFIHISFDRSEQKALEWAKKEGFSWKHVLPGALKESGLAKFRNVNYVPFYCLVDKDGNVVATGQDAVFKQGKKLTK